MNYNDMKRGNEMPINIAIDGPAGAGKSTVAKKLAEDYGYIYVDTGAMYRAMALYFLRQGIDSHDEAAIGRACETVSISLEYENGIQQVYLNGENVSSELRTEAVGNMASNTSVYAPVRKKLVELQRELAGRRDVVMDGRDIGTAVLPDATLKVYLTASSRVRAGRRYKELTERGESCPWRRSSRISSSAITAICTGNCRLSSRRRTPFYWILLSWILKR